MPAMAPLLRPDEDEDEGAGPVEEDEVVEEAEVELPGEAVDAGEAVDGEESEAR